MEFVVGGGGAGGTGGGGHIVVRSTNIGVLYTQVSLKAERILELKWDKYELRIFYMKHTG